MNTNIGKEAMKTPTSALEDIRQKADRIVQMSLPGTGVYDEAYEITQLCEEALKMEQDKLSDTSILDDIESRIMEGLALREPEKEHPWPWIDGTRKAAELVLESLTKKGLLSTTPQPASGEQPSAEGVEILKRILWRHEDGEQGYQ